jgi:hypothetical protein
MKYKIATYRIPQQGDIVLVKSFSLLGWLIGRAFRCDSPLAWLSGARPSNHNGVIGFSSYGIPCVYESLFWGFRATPLADYIEKAVAGLCEFKIVRLKTGLQPKQLLGANFWLNENLGVRYDFRSYLSHIWRLILRMPPIWNSNNKTRWYCTEAVQTLYAVLGETALADKHLIAPIHIEQAVAAGAFEIIAECVPF